MASRIGGGSPPPFTPPASTSAASTSAASTGTGGDNRLEQMRERQLKELLEQRTVRTRDEGEHVLNSLAKSLKNRDTDGSGPGSQGLRVAPASPDGTPVGSKRLENRSERAPPSAPAPGASAGAPSGSPSAPGANAGGAGAPNAGTSSAELPRLVADFQRQNGLPVTGRLDTSTVSAMKERGLIPPQNRESVPTPRAGKDDVAAARQTRAAAEQQTKQRVGDGAQTPRTDKSERAQGERRERFEGTREDRGTGVDRVVDPARLLASLFAAGFAGKGQASLDDAIKAFQTAQGLPVTGKVDAQTQESLKNAGVVEPEHAKTEKSVDTKQQVRRALNDASPTTKNAADRDVNRDPVRPQASTAQQTTSADVAARAPVTSSSDAAERARLDTVMAQQAATERGVQEGTGDPTATRGHGDVEGIGAGQRGAGGTSGGGGVEGHGPGAIGDGPEGDETAVGNAEAGDDDFNDDARGNANADGDQPGDEGEHWKVPPLSEQVHAALEAIARDDDGSGPVTYTWDVTFMRPGTYAAGQPAEELWHVAVKQATAFDPVWQQAADAISSRMLYGEPDADPPTIDDFIMALRRARVR